MSLSGQEEGHQIRPLRLTSDTMSGLNQQKKNLKTNDGVFKRIGQTPQETQDVGEELWTGRGVAVSNALEDEVSRLVLR